MECNANMKKKKIWSPSAGGWTPCPSEPKRGNVTTGLQRDSLNYVANLTVPICTWNVGFIDSLILLWKIWNEKKWKSLVKLLFFKYLFKWFANKKKITFPSRSVLLQVFACWTQANQERWNEIKKAHNKKDVFYGQPGLISYLKSSSHT